jgi:hypothetical protein
VKSSTPKLSAASLLAAPGAVVIMELRSLPVRQQPVGVTRLTSRRKPRVGHVGVLRVLGRACVVAGGRLVRDVVAPVPVFLELPRAGAEEDERTVARADEGVACPRRAVDEVPLKSSPLIRGKSSLRGVRQREEPPERDVVLPRPGLATTSERDHGSVPP